MTRRRPVRIGVIGSAQATELAARLARTIGTALAHAEAVLVCGGRGGVMAAAAAGASEEGGIVIGLLPGEDAAGASSGVTIPIPTGLGDARNTLVVRASEVLIAVSGGWGTLNEAALAMKLGRPLIGVHDSLGDAFNIERFSDPFAAVARAIELATEARLATGPAVVRPRRPERQPS